MDLHKREKNQMWNTRKMLKKKEMCIKICAYVERAKKVCYNQRIYESVMKMCKFLQKRKMFKE